MEKLTGNGNLLDSNIKNSQRAIQIMFAFIAFDFFREVMPGLIYIFYHPKTEFIYPYILKILNLFNPQEVSAFLIASSFLIYIQAVKNYRLQFWRTIVFLHFLVSRGFVFSFVRYSHMYLPILWVMLCLAVCPSFDSLLGQRYYQKTYFACLFSLAIFYFYSGLWKIILGLLNEELFYNDFGANTIAYYLITHGKFSLLGDFFIFNPMLANLSMYIIILFQLLTLAAVFIGSSQRLWALFVLVFHTINILVLSVNFLVIGTVVFIFFFFSPFNEREKDWLEKLINLLVFKIKKFINPCQPVILLVNIGRHKKE